MINELSSAVLACIIKQANCLSEIDLSDSDFFNDNHREIFLAAKQLEANQEQIDIISLSDFLLNKTGKNWMPVIGGIVLESTASPRNAKDYAERLKKYGRAEKIHAIALKIAEKADAGDISIEQEVGELMRINVPDSRYDWSMKESLEGAIELLSSALERDGLVGVDTGLKDINDAIGGFQNSDLYIIGARPAMGKTSMLLNFALNSGVPCGIISTEQGHSQVGQRFLASDGGVCGMKMRNAKLDDDEYKRLMGAMHRLQDKPIFINDKSMMTISELSRQARKWMFDYNIEILYVDYLQRIKADDLRIPKHEQVEQVVVGLKTLAKELNIPVVSLAQVNRNVDSRPDKRPRMGDLKDSGAVEQEADVIMMLYRDWVYDPSSNPATAEISIEKNRHGATGLIQCNFTREFMKFTDMRYGE